MGVRSGGSSGEGGRRPVNRRTQHRSVTFIAALKAGGADADYTSGGMENKMKKTFSFLLALCLLLSLLPVGAYASDVSGQGTVSGYAEPEIDDSALPEGQEILDSYALNMLYPQYSINLFSLGPEKLSDPRQQYIYGQLKEWLTAVAEKGNPAYLNMNTSGAELSWSYDELGISGPSDQQLQSSFLTMSGIDNVLNCLVVDMPYELYWYDKTQGVKSHYTLNLGESSVKLISMEFIFSVSNDYKSQESYSVTWDEKEITYYGVNSAKYNSVALAVAKAKAIVDSYAELNDYEKLKAYKDKICELTDYDHDTADAPSALYGDPWQLIYVFDSDPDTKVVCEGYSKAFQYLCDLSEFDDENTACYTVMGKLSGGGLTNTQEHEWNIVSLGGSHYLVDVTNSDTGTIGAAGQLFLAGASGDQESGYSVIIDNEALNYSYDMDADLKNMLGDVLMLSSTSYDPNAESQPECSHSWGEGVVTTEPTCTQAGEMTYTCNLCQETKTETIDALGHDWGEWTKLDENNHSHTCQRDGCGATETKAHSFVDGKCSVCGYQQPTEEHVHSYGEWQMDETQHWRVCSDTSCNKEERGAHSFVDGRCSVCGYQQPTEEHVHSWDTEWNHDETYHWHDCTDESCAEKSDYAEHSWNEGEVTKEATETEAGEMTFTCTVCQATKTEPIAATGPTEPTHTHNWSSEWKSDDSYHWHECTETGCTISNNAEKNGYAEHTWDEGEVTKEATETEAGEMTFICTVCQATKIEEIPVPEHTHSWSTGWTSNEQFHWHDCTDPACPVTDNSKKDGFGAHSWDNGTVIKEATTTSAGTIEYKCATCGRVKQEQIPILTTPEHSHIWSSAWTYNSTHHWHECTVSGCTISNAADKYGYAAHQFGAWRTVKEATATSEGLMERQCGCGYKESKTIPVNTQSQCNHNWSGWTFNYPNYWERSCSICHARDIKITQVAVPKIISGANAVWRQGSSNGLSFISDAPYSEFIDVYLNGFKLNESYYSVTEGSTIVTLKKSCLDQLGVGTHKLSIVSMGGTAETTFTVKSKTILNNQTPTYNSSKPWTTPKTGDSANMGLWIGMIAVCALGLGGVALYVVKSKKKKGK